MDKKLVFSPVWYCDFYMMLIQKIAESLPSIVTLQSSVSHLLKVEVCFDYKKKQIVTSIGQIVMTGVFSIKSILMLHRAWRSDSWGKFTILSITFKIIAFSWAFELYRKWQKRVMKVLYKSKTFNLITKEILVRMKVAIRKQSCFVLVTGLSVQLTPNFLS